MTDPHALVAAGHATALRGWPVFLLGRTKRPLANCPQCPRRDQPDAHDPRTCTHLTCHGFYAATRDPDRITAMVTAHPDGLLAVRTGQAPEGAGVVCIDIDPYHGGRVDPMLMPPTLAVATGGDGWHLYYRHPGHPVLSRPLPGRDGIDVKADGGYCVLPPSVHPDTHRAYRWANHRDVEEMSPALADTVLAPPASPATSPPQPRPGPGAQHRPGGAGERVADPDKLVDACLAAVARAAEGRRRVTLYGAARGVARAVRAGFDPDTAIALLTQAGHAADQTDRDIHAAISGAFTAEGIDTGSPF